MNFLWLDVKNKKEGKILKNTVSYITIANQMQRLDKKTYLRGIEKKKEIHLTI